MKKIVLSLFALVLFVPCVTFAAPLTQTQAESLINVVQASPGTPASAFTNLITAFSNITANQADSLIGVIQASPGVPADSFVDLLISFTQGVPNTSPASTQTTTQTDTQNSLVSNENVSQKNAVKAAQSYLNYTAFSHDGLVAQLEYEQFSPADAVYGADNSDANWDEQAAKAAKQYLAYSAFSRGSLIAQLEYDKFTQEQAEYGANAVGL